MPTSIRPVRVNHLNVVLEDYDAGLAHFRALFGADFLLDLPSAEWHACLIDIGRVIFEIFVPPAFLLNSRHGAHYLGIEYQANMDEVRAALTDHKVRIVRDIKVAVHTHPADGYGVAFEFYDGAFHDNQWAALDGAKMKPAEYWRDEHPLGLAGLKGYTLAVADLDAATAFFKSFISAEPVYDAARPAIAARARGLQVADAILELIAPTGDGPLQQHLQRLGQGIYSTVFTVRDLAQAQSYFAERGVPTVPGSAPDSIAIPAEANLGVIFEFTES